MRSRVISIAAIAAILGGGIGAVSAVATAPKTSDTSAHQDAAPAAPNGEKYWTAGKAQEKPSASVVEKAPVVDVERLKRTLDNAPDVGGYVPLIAHVEDVATGKSIYDKAGDTKMAPASTLKLVTSSAVLKILDPSMRLNTTILSSAPGQLTLVGEGDPILSPGPSLPDYIWGRAGIRNLAQQTAAELMKKGNVPDSITLTVDDSNWTEPLNPAWPQEDLDNNQLTKLSPFAMNSGYKARDSLDGPRVADPSMHTGETYAKELTKAFAAEGKTVSVKAVRGTKPEGSTEVTHVTSATVAELLSYALEVSDNYTVENLARVAAIKAGNPPTAAGVKKTIDPLLPKLTDYPQDIHMLDACGLSVQNTVSPRAMASLVQHLLSSDDPAWQDLSRMLAVAGTSGTLTERFADPSNPAKGILHAKTGTLNSVVALTGYVRDEQGRLYSFSLAYSGFNGHIKEGKKDLDALATEMITQ